MKTTETMVKILMILFCWMLTRPRNVSCMYSRRSKLKRRCSKSELMSLMRMLILALASAGMRMLLIMFEQTRCLSTMFSRMIIVRSCSSLMAMRMALSTSSSDLRWLLSSVISRVRSSMRSAS